MAALVLGACSGDEPPAWCVAPAGTPISFANAPVRWATSPRLVQLWESGAHADGGAFDSPNAVALHPASGVLAIADHATTSVTLLGADGRWLGRYDAAGRGAGELSLPEAVAWMADDRLAVYDSDNGKLLVLRADGALVSERRLDPMNRRRWPGRATLLQDSVVLVRAASALVAQPYPAPARALPTPERDLHILRGTGDWSVVDTIVTARVRMSAGDDEAPLVGAPMPVVAPLGDTLLAVAGDVAEYRLRIIDRDGAVVRQLCRIAEPFPLSAAESLLARESGERAPPAGVARIGRLFAGSGGRIWVQRDRGAGPLLADHDFGPPGAMFDVFERSGAYLGAVRAPADVRLVAARGDTVIGLRGRYSGLWVVAYGLEDVR